MNTNIISHVTMIAINKFSAIAVKMGQLKNKIQERTGALNLFLKNVKTKDITERYS